MEINKKLVFVMMSIALFFSAAIEASTVTFKFDDNNSLPAYRSNVRRVGYVWIAEPEEFAVHNYFTKNELQRLMIVEFNESIMIPSEEFENGRGGKNRVDSIKAVLLDEDGFPILDSIPATYPLLHRGNKHFILNVALRAAAFINEKMDGDAQ